MVRLVNSPLLSTPSLAPHSFSFFPFPRSPPLLPNQPSLLADWLSSTGVQSGSLSLLFYRAHMRYDVRARTYICICTCFAASISPVAHRSLLVLFFFPSSSSLLFTYPSPFPSLGRLDKRNLCAKWEVVPIEFYHARIIYDVRVRTSL